MAFRRGGRPRPGGAPEAEPSRLVAGFVTEIAAQQRPGSDRENVFIDGVYAFSLAVEVAATLRVGQVLSEQDCGELLARDEYHRALASALNFLSYRPRSEREIRDRLGRHDFAAPTLTAVLERLRELRLVDDEAFAEYWIGQRQAHAPRGSLLLKQELFRKGVASETTAAAIDSAELDDDTAYQAGAKRARQLRAAEQRDFTQRMSAYLARRGFGWDVVSPAVKRLWLDRETL